MATFKNTRNGYKQSVTQSGAFLGCLVFGAIYFAYKGVWKHFFIGWLAAFCTLGISWLVYPFFAYQCVRHSYLERGWQEVGKGKAIARRPSPQKSSRVNFDFLPS